MDKEFQDFPDYIATETCLNGKDKGKVFLNISGKRFALSDFEFVLCNKTEESQDKE